MHTYPLSVLRRQMRDSRSPADLRHIERGTWHENAFVTRAEPPLGAAVGYEVILLCPRITGRSVASASRRGWSRSLTGSCCWPATWLVSQPYMGLGRCQLRALWASMPADRSRCCGPGRSLVADVSAFLGEVAARAALGWMWWLAVRAGIAARAFWASRTTVPPAGRWRCGLGAADLVTSVRWC
jgi:hypothetical protein